MPARKPTRLKEISGTARKDRLKANEPKPAPATTDPPDWLQGRALAEWNRVAPELLRLQLLTMVDLPALAGYCSAYARAVDAEAVIAAEGPVLETPQGFKQARPEVSIARSAWEHVRKFASEFGLTPVARGRLDVPIESGRDSLDEFLEHQRFFGN